MWMAEGFLGADDKEMESVGDMYLELLLSNSLLQQVDDAAAGYGYAMHHLLHDVASSVLSSWTDADGNSLVRYSLRDEQSPVLPKQAAKYLRTLVLQGDISGTLFSDFESLHVLTLDGCNVKELPRSIRKLIHLRNLNVSRTSIEKLPDWIDQLLQLQTLRAEGEYLRKLPSTLKYLIKLRHLYIYDNVELPAEIGRLTHLWTLRYFPVDAKNGFKIEELGSLKNLKGNLTIDNLEKVEGKEEAKKANMSEKPELKELVLKWDRNRSEGETNDDESVLEGLKPHPNLSKLRIEGFKGKRFPWWTMNDVVEIRLSWCSECEEIPNMPNLKSLYSERLKKMRFIDSSFSKLMKLHVEGLERLECLPDELFYKNSNLSYLKILDCPKLRGLPEALHALNSLEELEIWNCPNLKSMRNISRAAAGEGEGAGNSELS